MKKLLREGHAMFKESFLYLVIVSILVFSGCIIKGKVVDENGAGVAGVTVTLDGSFDNMTTTTDINGEYQFGTLDNMLYADFYFLTLSKSGYSFVSKSDYIFYHTLFIRIENKDFGELGVLPEAKFNLDFLAMTGATLVVINETWNGQTLKLDDNYLGYSEEGFRGPIDEWNISPGYHTLEICSDPLGPLPSGSCETISKTVTQGMTWTVTITEPNNAN